MTAINIMTNASAATVYADGAQYLPDGSLVGFERKARRLGEWKAVSVTTGLAAAGGYLNRVLPGLAGSFDDFLARRDYILPFAMSAIRSHLSGSEFPRFAAFLVGWSDLEGRPEIVVYDDRHGTGDGRIFTTNEIVSPVLSEEQLMQVRLSLANSSPSRRDVAVAVMEAQRRKAANPAFAKVGTHFVGGHMTETVIGDSGIREKIIHRWNDKLGELVKPDAVFPVNVTPLVAGSRSERRRLGAEQRGIAQ